MEEKEKGAVSIKVYWYYIWYGGGVIMGGLLGLLGLVSLFAITSSGLWLSFWATESFGLDLWVYILIYVVLGILEIVIYIAKEVKIIINDIFS